MKKLVLLLTAGAMWAQTPATPPTPVPHQDTTSAVSKLQKDAQLSTMDAVKTQDHVKSAKAPATDTVRVVKKKKRSATRRSARP